MQRLLNNLLTVAVIGLLSTSASLAMAKGGGGGHGGGGHSGGGRSSGSHSGMSHSNAHRSSMHKSTSHTRSHKPMVHDSHKNKSPNGTKAVKPTKNLKLAGNGNHHDHHDHHGYRHGGHYRWHDHLRYPVGFWFSSEWANGDVADGDVVDGGIDVEFSKIQQIDAGDPTKNLAPAYRVWFHNNSDVDIAQPFDVAILASSDDQLAQGLPYSSVRIDTLAADETTSVDIRLPIEAMSMATADGQMAPFSYVHTIIDSQKELVETNKANNLSLDSRDNIPAVDTDSE